MCGHSSGSPGGLWHFDGKEWKVVDIFNLLGEGGSYYAVHGLSEKDIWVVGGQLGNYEKRIYNPLIIKYDGIKWQRYRLEANIKSFLYSVYVKDKNDVWICGSNGIVGHYNHIYYKWEIDTVKIEIPEDGDYSLYSIGCMNGKTYVYGNISEEYGLKYTFYFFEYDGNNWRTIDSFKYDKNSTFQKFGTNKMIVSLNNNLYTMGFGLWKRETGKWTDMIEYKKDFRGFYEMDENNMLIVGSFGEIYHFNGSNWQSIDIPNDDNFHYTGVFMTKTSTTIIGLYLDQSIQKTIVWKGK